MPTSSFLCAKPDIFVIPPVYVKKSAIGAFWAISEKASEVMWLSPFFSMV